MKRSYDKNGMPLGNSGTVLEAELERVKKRMTRASSVGSQFGIKEGGAQGEIESTVLAAF